jgi:hypothetical protein
MTFAFDLTVTLGVIVAVVAAIVGWVRAGRRDIDDRIAGLAARADGQAGRIAAVEHIIGGLPGLDQVHTVQLSLADMRGELREIRALMQGNVQVMQRLEAIVTRHEEHLLEGKR